MKKSVEIKLSLKNINAEIKKINLEIDQLTKAIIRGVDSSILAPKSKESAIRLDNCKSKRKQILEEKKIKNEISASKITDYMLYFKNMIKNGNYEQQHKAIISFLKQIIADPDEKKIYLKFYEFPSELINSSSGGARNRN
ncbi:MAG: hypothetical protein PHR39_03875 [Actinomycetota bacterium]|nr:hypothetical protein [Actinomycetota bacterium]